MNEFYPYSKRDPIKNYFPLPNEIFHIGLSYGAIAVYGYLLHIENRKTFRSYAGYHTIGEAVKMCANTVRKYVSELEDKRLVRTEPTTVFTGDGHKRNGTLLYHIRPIVSPRVSRRGPVFHAGSKDTLIAGCLSGSPPTIRPSSRRRSLFARSRVSYLQYHIFSCT